MILTPRGLLEHSRTESGRRMIRYASTSIICVGITQVLIVLFLHAFGLTEIESNLAATMLTSVPAYMLNKYWVWGKKGRPHMRREVIPFWVFTVAGWALSTLMVAFARGVGEDGSLSRTLAVMVASISGFGILWVLKYLFLDKLMFGPDHHTPYDEDEEHELEELADAGVVPEA